MVFDTLVPLALRLLYIHQRTLTYQNRNFECVIKDFHCNLFGIFRDLCSVSGSQLIPMSFVSKSFTFYVIYDLSNYFGYHSLFPIHFSSPKVLEKTLLPGLYSLVIQFSFLVVFFARLDNNLLNTEYFSRKH